MSDATEDTEARAPEGIPAKGRGSTSPRGPFCKRSEVSSGRERVTAKATALTRTAVVTSDQIVMRLLPSGGAHVPWAGSSGPGRPLA